MYIAWFVVALLDHLKTGLNTGRTGYIAGSMDDSVLAQGEVTVSSDVFDLGSWTDIT